MSIEFLRVGSNKQKGVGLIEVIVALFILAVGLLGVLAMQANSIKGNQKSQFSTEAHFLAQDMAERIQAFDDIDIVSDDDDYDNITTVLQIPANPNCATSGCNASQQITYDTWDWGTQLASRLPNGKGTVDFTAGMYTIQVMWDGELDGSTGTNCNGAAGQMTCYALEFKL